MGKRWSQRLPGPLPLVVRRVSYTQHKLCPGNNSTDLQSHGTRPDDPRGLNQHSAEIRRTVPCDIMSGQELRYNVSSNGEGLLHTSPLR